MEAKPFCIPINSVQEFKFLRVLTNTYCLLFLSKKNRRNYYNLIVKIETKANHTIIKKYDI